MRRISLLTILPLSLASVIEVAVYIGSDGSMVSSGASWCELGAGGDTRVGCCFTKAFSWAVRERFGS